MRWDDANCGRMSQAMCYMMYAEMVMYQNDTSRYPTALQYMQEIIDDTGMYWRHRRLCLYLEGEWRMVQGEHLGSKLRDRLQRACWSNPLAIGGTVLANLHFSKLMAWWRRLGPRC